MDIIPRATPHFLSHLMSLWIALLQVKVKMKNLANDNEWLWDKNKFINRKYIMQEMYQNYTDGDESNVDKVNW